MVPPVLVAGIGNVVRGDDGFGIHLLRLLEPLLRRDDRVELVEVGSAGLIILQELSKGARTGLVMLDAARGNQSPGTLYSWRLKVTDSQQDAFEELEVPEGQADLHEVQPERLLIWAGKMGLAPPSAYLVACEPLHVDVIASTLSPVVERTLPKAVKTVLEIINHLVPPKTPNEETKGKGEGHAGLGTV